MMFHRGEPEFSETVRSICLPWIREKAFLAYRICPKSACDKIDCSSLQLLRDELLLLDCEYDLLALSSSCSIIVTRSSKYLCGKMAVFSASMSACRPPSSLPQKILKP